MSVAADAQSSSARRPPQFRGVAREIRELHWKSVDGQFMFAPVNRARFRRIVFALVMAQWLFAPPVASAFATLAGAAPHCGDVMLDQLAVDPGADQDCACCPERGMNAAACLSACAASLGALPVFEFPVSPAGTMPARREPVIPHALLADPPLHPPPIA